MYKIAVILLICILFLFNSIEENSDTMFLEGFKLPTIPVPTIPVPTIQVPTVPTIQVPTLPSAPTVPTAPDGYSSNDVVFTPAPQTGEVTVQNNEQTAISESVTTFDESKQNYKNKRNELNTIKKSFGLTKKQNADFNISQNALILNNVTLGIGILGMMWVVYNK